MLIVHSPHHKGHLPASFVVAGNARPHPDTVERVDGLLHGIRAGGHRIIEPADHGLQYIAQVHQARYLDFLSRAHREWMQLPGAATAMTPNVHPRRSGAPYPRSIVGRAGYHIYDLAIPIGEGSWPAVVWNSHAAAEAAVRVRDGEVTEAYALCRPPGHHAGPDYAGGFCLINNAAVAATVLRERYWRVAILDIDVHHGNGTQDIFYERPDVLFASLHGDPADFYPFYWGYASERGAGAGEGANLNVPLARGVADDEYLSELDQVLGRLQAAGVEALVVSLGFDGYEKDPLAWLRLTTSGFGRIAARIASAGLPTVLVQEGGYLCSDLGRNLDTFLAGFRDGRQGGSGEPTESA